MKPLTINLALQGGGAHGAFTWGVLSRLLDEQWLSFEGISGTSAGAMNAVMLTEGWRKGGREGAKSQLDAFWNTIAEQGVKMPVPNFIQHSVSKMFMSMFEQFSPYEINVLDINPLKEVLLEQVDFKALRRQCDHSLYIAATEVTTGKLELFREQELSAEHVLASACLPHLYKAVEIHSKFYWDGGYAGNPAVYPLIHDCDANDVLIVLLQPLQRKNVPQNSSQIKDRVNELTFHSAFLREMRGILDVKMSSQRWGLVSGEFEKKIRSALVHLIENNELMNSLEQLSKYDNSLEFLQCLRDRGIATAEKWLSDTAGDLGKRDSCDVVGLFS